MLKPDPLVEIEVGVRGDTAAALGRVGRTLALAINALTEFDQRGEPRSEHRTALLYTAASALWAYVVQKEAIGITDNTKVNEIYGVTSEVWRLMGSGCGTSTAQSIKGECILFGQPLRITERAARRCGRSRLTSNETIDT